MTTKIFSGLNAFYTENISGLGKRMGHRFYNTVVIIGERGILVSLMLGLAVGVRKLPGLIMR